MASCNFIIESQVTTVFLFCGHNVFKNYELIFEIHQLVSNELNFRGQLCKLKLAL